MNITVIGIGYVGLVTSACFAETGNSVVGFDIDLDKINLLNQGTSPLFEPGLNEMLQQNRSRGRLRFTNDIREAIEYGDIIFSCVGTPRSKDDAVDVSQVKIVAENFGKYMNNNKILVNKSTVPIGTTEACIQIIQKELDKRGVDYTFEVVSNPEFLKQGSGIKDTMNPDRIIIGCDSENARNIMKKLYQPIVRTGKPIIFTNAKTAELTKYAANAFLGMKISYINELANFAENHNINIRDVARGIGLDDRIGPRFLHAGIGYGGNCLQKDIKALINQAKKSGSTLNIIESVDKVNENQKKLFIKKLKNQLSPLKNKKIAVWGLTFKPKTDDLRDAPSIEIVKQLIDEGAELQVFDPIVTKKFVNNHFRQHKGIKPAKTNYDALKGVDALMILTEWDEFRSPDFAKIKELMKGDLVLDGRNIYDPEVVRSAGLHYIGIGTV